MDDWIVAVKLATGKSPEPADRNVRATHVANGFRHVAQAFQPAGSRDFPVPSSNSSSINPFILSVSSFFILPSAFRNLL